MVRTMESLIMQPSTHRTYSVLQRLCSIAAVGLLALSPLSASRVRAQVQGLPGLGQSGAGNGLGGLSGGLPSVSQAGPANLAGVLQYCIQNNILSSSVAGQTQTALLGQAPGSAQSSGFTAGSSGLLQTGNNQTFSLSNAQPQIKQEVCNIVLQQAKSAL
jgi:hypothetical protein